ncbi:MAG: glycosyltransferase family 2 protein, partial [Clostridiales bacterium]|nr:glycosyltransferase family 2 protein [Clostridiales bacterium]
MGRLIFFLNNDFRLCLKAGRPYFVHRESGDQVITDELGRAVWESLPGTEEEVVKKAVERTGAQEGLVHDFLRVMLNAGIINCLSEGLEGKEEKKGKEGEGGGAQKKEEGNARFIAQKEMISPDEEARDARVVATGLVSVIIVTFNSEEHIRGCLDSVLGQTYKNLEVMVVDNASKDRTVEIAQSYHPRVKVFPLRKNIYFPGAVNYGIEKAAGDFFLILNDDLELDSGCVRRLVERMSADVKAGAVVPMMKFYHLRGFINGIGNQIRERGWGSDNFIGCVDIGQFRGLTEVPSACFGAVLVRRKAVEDIGPLDPKYKSYYEDSDWSFRCWMRGWKIVPEVRALVYHKFGAHWKTMERKLKLVARNRLRLVLKLFQGRALPRFL